MCPGPCVRGICATTGIHSRPLRAGAHHRRQCLQTVILCGVRDLRDYRIHARSEITGGSAFNIKAKSLRLGDFSALHSAIRPGGYALLAEFSTTGARQCAGLELHRYSVEEMTERMGPEFALIADEEYLYTSPSGDPRPYVYALYQKSDSS